MTLGSEDAWSALHGCKVFVASSGEEVRCWRLVAWMAEPQASGQAGRLSWQR